MLVAFFESIKYVGHLLPIAFLRIYTGYYFFDQAVQRFYGDYLQQPKLAAVLTEAMPSSHLPEWYKNFLDQIVVPNWRIFAYIIVYCQFIIGLSYISGFFVRPVGLLGMLITLNFIFNSGPELADLSKMQFAVFFMMTWLGAGRCLGFDYFFYKRDRGLWW